MADRAQKTRQKLTFRLAAARPRNPFAVLAKQRAAGPHRKSASAIRSAQRQALQRRIVRNEGEGDSDD